MVPPANIRSVFGTNLRNLCEKYPTVVQAASALEINRTQLNRYLNGDSFPRPDQLAKICDHFGVDARILTTQLDKIAPPTSSLGLDPFFNESFRPVPKELFPDGFYNEWTVSYLNNGKVDRFLGMAFTKDGNRFFKIKAPTLLDQEDGQTGKRKGWQSFIGQAFLQMNNFAIIDRGPHNSTIAMTSFVSGFSTNANLFLGYKLAGSSWDILRPHARMAVVLEFLGPTRAAALKADRNPNTFEKEAVSPLILKALRYVANSGGANVV